MARHRLSRDQVIWAFGPDLEPVLEIEPGDVVTFETNDCFTGQIKSEADLVTDIDLGRINSATGPVAVRGAEPGDSLVVEILDVRPVEWGVATLIPGFGQLSGLVEAPVTQMFQVQQRDGEDEREDLVPGQPDGRRRRRRDRRRDARDRPCGPHGGNLDDHWHGKGSRIFFPVRQPGGMFAVGDMHAAMGDGEICFTGVEIAGEVDIRFDVLESRQATWPVTAKSAQAARGHLQEVVALEERLAGGDRVAGVVQTHDREARDALAAARFADDPERLPLLDREADAVDGLDDAVVGAEARPQLPRPQGPTSVESDPRVDERRRGGPRSGSSGS